MADILKITTPLVSKTQTPDPKKNVELSTQFNLQDTTRVKQPTGQSGLLRQNNGMLGQEETSALLMNLLKDPSVTVNFLKNIFALQEIIKLMPVNNSTFTQEIEQLFKQLLVSPEQIAGELARQENASTSFKGALFDFLRDTLSQYPEQKDLRGAVLSFLKAINAFSSRQEVLDAVGNSLGFLAESLDASKSLSQRLSDLAGAFRQENAPDRFEFLKRDVLELFKDIEDSILFSPKMAKVLSTTLYNLSRYNDNPDFLQETISQLLSRLRGNTARETFMQCLEQYMVSLRQGGGEDRNSKVMQALTQIIGRQTRDEELMMLNSDKLEKIITSLLSSPCNFTPLLHFVIPVQDEQMQSFAEIWVNPNGSEDERGEETEEERSIHMLLVFDIDSIGRFEMELFVRGEKIDLSLFCPPAYVKEFAGMGETLPKCVQGMQYHFGEVRVDRLERARSLMDVFKSLPYKRTGVDVTI